MKMDDLTKKINFFVSGIILIGALMFSLFLIEMGLMSTDNRLVALTYGTDLTYMMDRYGYQLLLTIAFSLSLIYAVLGAIISGSVTKTDLHPCFVCLFSTAIPFSMVGIGMAWLGHVSFAAWLMFAVVLLISVTSYCAQHHKELWPHYSNELQRNGREF